MESKTIQIEIPVGCKAEWQGKYSDEPQTETVEAPVEPVEVFLNMED